MAVPGRPSAKAGTMTRTCFVHTQNTVVHLRMLCDPANLSLNQTLQIWGQTSSFLQAPLIPKQPGQQGWEECALFGAASPTGQAVSSAYIPSSRESAPWAA